MELTFAHDLSSIMSEILRGYALPVTGYHGVVHWSRVLENGLRVAEVTGGDREVVALFALFHDSRRINENHDKGHGHRGALLAQELRGSLVHLEDDWFDLLHEACRLHTDGLIVDEPSLAACWDADRLDLGRVGITPQPHRLCTEAARDLLGWAHDRATRDHVPVDVLTAYGLDAGLRMLNSPRARDESS
jgi:uncharacterized protein